MESFRCPVCRYVQSPEMQEQCKCSDCDLRENLWICLICGNLGCGRYGHKHAYAHFENTGHTFALEVTTNLVWDYADDAYVHRIAVNHEDGKVVQVGHFFIYLIWNIKNFSYFFSTMFKTPFNKKYIKYHLIQVIEIFIFW